MKTKWHVLLALLLLSAPAALHGQFGYMTNDDGVSITLTGYAGAGGAVTIPTNINGLVVTSIGAYAFNENQDVTGVTIPGSVTNIGVFAFFDCTRLASVAIPGSVTSIGANAFEYCVSLAGMTIPDGVASIGANAFQDCYILSSVTIPDSVTSIGDSAFRAAGLTNVMVPGSVAKIGNRPFAECINLAGITVDPQNSCYRSVHGVLFDKSLATLIQYPGGVSGGYTIPDSVTNIGPSAFMECSGLTKVTIPGSVKNIGDGAFEFCEHLTNVTMAQGVASIGDHAFNYCPELASITIPGSVTNIGPSAFLDCTNLSSVFFRGDAPPGVPANVFYANNNATAYYLPCTTGWDDFSANTGLPAVLWNPSIQTHDGSFGLSNNQFGFNITATTTIPIVVEACTNLASPVWTPLANVILTKSFYFSDPQWTNYPVRFYRISPP